MNTKYNKEKIQIGIVTISSKRRLYKKLLEGYRLGYHNKHPKLYYYIMGCYDSSLFGICIYNNSSEKYFESK